MKQRLIAILLATAFYLTACSKKEETKPSSETSPAISTETEMTTTTEATTTTSASTETTPKYSYETQLGPFVSSLDTFEVRSESITDMDWDVKIGNNENTTHGENLSPQLSWDEVEGASCYAVYMLDISANNWMHLKYLVEGATSLELGEVPDYVTAPKGRGYCGPYPPAGSTHAYVIYVVALKSADTKIGGMVNVAGKDTEALFTALDTTTSGETGNVIAYGELGGAYCSDW
ncbi:MAG: hypothetical protein KBT07_08305 [Clostridiales bacterium]|nr:hypothetical protein [Candidatus Scatonaster coprocaballi]